MTEIKREGDNQKGEFVIYENDKRAGRMTYEKEQENQIIVEHTNVEEEFGGRGLAGKLMDKMVEYARENNLKINPSCSYVQHKFKKDEAIRDVLAEGSLEI